MSSSHRLLHRARTGLAVLGAAALIVAGVDLGAQAAQQAAPLLLGKSNKAGKVTKLTSKKGPALSLKSKKGPALAVNSSDLVAHLNADMVDGKSAGEIVPGTTQYLAGAPHVGPGSYIFQTTLQPGTYQMGMHASFQADSGGTGFDATCVVLDPAVLTPPLKPELVFLADAVDETSAPWLTTDASLVTLTAPTTIDYGCLLDGDATFGRGFVLTVTPVPNLATGTGTPTALSRTEAERLVQQLGR
jgi:hypothetical protein